MENVSFFGQMQKGYAGCFEKDFSEPFHKYLEGEHKKQKIPVLTVGMGLLEKKRFLSPL